MKWRHCYLNFLFIWVYTHLVVFFLWRLKTKTIMMMITEMSILNLNPRIFFSLSLFNSLFCPPIWEWWNFFFRRRRCWTWWKMSHQQKKKISQQISYAFYIYMTRRWNFFQIQIKKKIFFLWFKYIWCSICRKGGSFDLIVTIFLLLFFCFFFFISTPILDINPHPSLLSILKTFNFSKFDASWYCVCVWVCVCVGTVFFIRPLLRVKHEIKKKSRP